jgi:hypothetical protein
MPVTIQIAMLVCRWQSFSLLPSRQPADAVAGFSQGS